MEGKEGVGDLGISKDEMEGLLSLIDKIAPHILFLLDTYFVYYEG